MSIERNAVQLFFAMLTHDKKKISIGDLYPELTADERREAEENLLRYLRVVKHIFEYLSAEKPEILTELRRRARLRGEAPKGR